MWWAPIPATKRYSLEPFRFKRVFFYVAAVFAAGDLREFFLFEVLRLPFVRIVKDDHLVVKQDRAVNKRIEKLVFLFIPLILFVREIVEERLDVAKFQRLDLLGFFDDDFCFKILLRRLQGQELFFRAFRVDSVDCIS